MRKLRRLELVRVLTPGFLVNSARHACRYETDDGRTLAPGYYLALGSDGTIHYDRDTRYFGPFETATATHFLQASTVAMGIVESAVSVPSHRNSAVGIGRVDQMCDAATP